MFIPFKNTEETLEGLAALGGAGCSVRRALRRCPGPRTATERAPDRAPGLGCSCVGERSGCRGPGARQRQPLPPFIQQTMRPESLPATELSPGTPVPTAQTPEGLSPQLSPGTPVPTAEARTPVPTAWPPGCLSPMGRGRMGTRRTPVRVKREQGPGGKRAPGEASAAVRTGRVGSG